MSKREPASKTIVMRAAGSYSNVARALAANNRTPPGRAGTQKLAIPTSPGRPLRLRPKR